MGYLWLRGALISTSAYVGDTLRWVTVNAFSGQNYNTYDRKFGYTVSNTTGGSYTYSIKASRNEDGVAHVPFIYLNSHILQLIGISLHNNTINI